jgi:diguanylate cyclase (GGDEF)-like protein
MLQQEYEICTVEDGTDALKKAEEMLPDIILLDILMPGVDGFDVITRLKSSGKTKDIPVIFITGVSDNESEIKGLAAGAVDYIHKPLNDAIVKLRVRQQIQLKNQMKKIEYLSMVDQLTDLPNRRSFEKRINEEWKRSVREQTPLSILILDIDHFKKYNDTYGHQQGDVILQATAKEFFKALRRPGDFAARWGGEEFVILLCNTDLNGALDIAEKVRALIEAMEIYTPGGTATSVTISIGVNFRAAGQSGTIDEFISKADTALYDAKNKGRNRVCCADGGASNLLGG